MRDVEAVFIFEKPIFVCGRLFGTHVDKKFRMLTYRRAIDGHVVADKIQKEQNAFIAQAAAQFLQRCVSAERIVHHVIVHGVGRGSNVVGIKIGLDAADLFLHLFGRARDRAARRTFFPNAHEPNGVKTQFFGFV